MLKIRRSSDRGHANHGWLDTRHSFSFADYYDEAHMGFRGLRVINEDHIAPGTGFGMHPHKDMEIITYVLKGALAHKDSIGNGSVIRPGEIQRMSAGSGIRHSEFNASDSDPVHLLQIWIVPAERDISPSYEQKTIPREQLYGHLQLIASPDPSEESVRICADTKLYATVLEPGQSVSYRVCSKRHAWIQIAMGKVKIGETILEAGDGASTSNEGELVLAAEQPAEILVFDLA